MSKQITPPVMHYLSSWFDYGQRRASDHCKSYCECSVPRAWATRDINLVTCRECLVFAARRVVIDLS